MFDFNEFKRSVKIWIKENPEGTASELRDYCEDKIPANQYPANEWVVEQTVSWYKHILAQRDYTNKTGNGVYSENDMDDVV